MVDALDKAVIKSCIDANEFVAAFLLDDGDKAKKLLEIYKVDSLAVQSLKRDLETVIETEAMMAAYEGEE